MGGMNSRPKPEKVEEKSRSPETQVSQPEGEEVKEEVAESLGFAWVTLATNDSYSLGALVLAHSLRNVKTAHKLAVMITPAVSQSMRDQLSIVYDVVKVVDVLDSKDEANLALLKRPELGITYTKIYCWKLTDFDKCVFLDADTLVVKNCDELFEREELSAAPDVGWPDCFNTGVFVFKPSIETFNNIIQFSQQQGSFDGGDQGLLNKYFSDWATKDIGKHLPFVYNLTSVAVYSYIPAFKQYGTEARIIHFIGTGKPWLQQLDPATKTVNPVPGAEHLVPMLQIWWDIFCEKVHPSLTKNLECASRMKDLPIEVCDVNSSLKCSDDDDDDDEQIQSPPSPEPYTPYIDKDDTRQINLPYCPSEVKSSSGELLNITFFEARESEMREEEAERKQWECETEPEQSQESWKPEDSSKESDKSDESPKSREEDPSNDSPELSAPKLEGPTQSGEPEEKPSPFEYESFFPDDSCVQNYLEQNVVQYRPLDDQETEILKKPDTPEAEEVSVETSAPQDQPLPRFLSLAENDKRQSLNEQHEKRLDICDYQAAPEDTPTVQEVMPKWKSLPSLETLHESRKPDLFQKTDSDSNKKYVMPKLKPLLPKQSFSNCILEEGRVKVTQYTEFNMSSEYRDVIELPHDKLGFVERQILKEAKERYHGKDREASLRCISYIFPQVRVSLERQKHPETFYEGAEPVDYDLSSCQRQLGNCRKIERVDSRKENSCFLPVLKRIRPGSREGRRQRAKPQKERCTKAKIESKKARERTKSESAVVERKPAPKVEDILKKLMDFSKDYQEYFGDCRKNKVMDTLKVATLKKGQKESPRLLYDKEFEVGEDSSFEILAQNGSSNEVQFNGQSNSVNVNQDRLDEENEFKKAESKKIVSLERTKRKSTGSKRKKRSLKPVEPAENGTASSSESKSDRLTYAAVAKMGPKTFECNVIVPSLPVRSKHRTSIQEARTSRDRKFEKTMTHTQTAVPGSTTPPVRKQMSRSAPPSLSSRKKPSNIFTLLPPEVPTGDEDSTPCPNRPQSSLKPSCAKPPATKTVQDKAVNAANDSSIDNSGIAGAIAKLSLQPGGLTGAESEAASAAQEDYIRRQNWEAGTMDYMGRDSFGNIWSKICETLEGKVSKEAAAATKPSSPPVPAENAALKTDKAEEPTQQFPKKDVQEMKGETDAEQSNPTVSDEGKTAANNGITDLAAKANEALEAFGKMFVSGPVVLKSTDAREESKAEGEGEKPEEKVTDLDEEGKPKKGVIGKILDLVGVGPKEGKGKQETSKSIFYDVEDPPKQAEEGGKTVSQSVFYDQSEKKDESVPNTQIMTATPPTSPLNTQAPMKNEKLLNVDDSIKATPPVTDKTFSDFPQENPKATITAEVEKIIDVAKKTVEEQLKNVTDTVSALAETVKDLPTAPADVLEAFGKSFVSGPVTLKSEEEKPAGPGGAAKQQEVEKVKPEEGKPIIEAAVEAATEALEAFGKSFVSGPVSLKSEVPEEKPVEEKKSGDEKTDLPKPVEAAGAAPLEEAINQAMEIFGKAFVSGPVTLKSEVPEEPPKPKSEESKPQKPKSDPDKVETPQTPGAVEALEAFGKSFVSGPVTLKSEIPEETKKPAEEQKDAKDPKSESMQVQAETAKPEAATGDAPKTAVAEGTPIEPAKTMPPIDDAPKEIAKSDAPQVPSGDVPKKVESLTPQAPGETPKELTKPEILQTPQPPSGDPLKEGLKVEAPQTTAKDVPKTGSPQTPATEIPKEPTGTTPSTPLTPESIPKESSKPETPPTPTNDLLKETSKPESPKSTDGGVPKELSKPEAPQTPQPLAGDVPKSGVKAEATKTEPPRPTADTPMEPAKSAIPQTPESAFKEPSKLETPLALQTPSGATPQDSKTPQTPVEAANQALEAIGKSFVSDFATIKSEVPEEAAKSKAEEQKQGLKMDVEKPVEGEAKEEEKPKTDVAQSPKGGEPPKDAPQTPVEALNQALEVFGKSFVSGPVTLKSEVPEGKAEPEEQKGKRVPGEEVPKPESAVQDASCKQVEAPAPSKDAGKKKASFGKKSAGKTEKATETEKMRSEGQKGRKKESETTDAVHHVFREERKPTEPEEPIYCNIDEVEEIKVTSEQERKKDKPKSSKLSDQILKAIPPPRRKPFSDSKSDGGKNIPEEEAKPELHESPDVSILLDRTISEEEAAATAAAAAPVESKPTPPVPPRRNRSKSRQPPMPPPKKKSKK